MAHGRDKLRNRELPPMLVEGARGRVLKVALQLFAKRGFHATSIRDIAGALEVQPSALYSHFSSKEQLLAELVRLGYQFHHESLVTSLLSAPADPAEQLRTIVAANARVHATYPLLAIVVNEEMNALGPELLGPAMALRDHSVLLFRQIMERGISSGQFNPPDAMTTVAAIAAMGVRIPYWFGEQQEIDIEGLARAQAELALRMVGVKSQRT